MDDKLYDMIRHRLDEGTETMNYLCKHVVSTEATMREIHDDVKDIKEACCTGHALRITRAEKQVKYIQGGMAIIIIMFGIVLSGAIP